MKISASSATTRDGNPGTNVPKLQLQLMRLTPLLLPPPDPGTRSIAMGSDDPGGRMPPNSTLSRARSYSQLAATAWASAGPSGCPPPVNVLS